MTDGLCDGAALQQDSSDSSNGPSKLITSNMSRRRYAIRTMGRKQHHTNPQGTQTTSIELRPKL